jgi:hypothetical protein
MTYSHRTFLRAALAAPFALAACGDNLDGTGDDEPVPEGRVVTGSHLVHYRALDGSELEQLPVDLFDTLIEAQVPSPTGEGWDVVGGAGHRDGSFTIAGLPDGPLWLRIATRPVGEAYIWTDTDHLDLDETVLGPEDPPRALEGDELLLDVDGLSPWTAGDALAWFVPDDIVYDTDLVQLSPPGPETTDLDGLPVDWSGRVLASVASGDQAYVVQYRPQTLVPGSPDVQVFAPLRAASPVIDQVAGENATLAATVIKPDALPYRLAWARETFEAERTAIHPTRAGASYYHDWAMTALPAIVDGEVWITVEYPLARLVDGSILEGTTPLDLGELAIPNPYPREWITDSYVVAFPVDYPMPDGTPFQLEAAIGTRRRDFTPTPATPAVTPIRAPRLAGRDAFADNTGVGVTPELAWTAPATGTATAYQVRVIEALTEPPPPYRPGWYLVTELWVPGDVTSLAFPADVLVPGHTYGLIVRAFAQPGQDIGTRPYRTGADAAFADAILGTFTP